MVGWILCAYRTELLAKCVRKACLAIMLLISSGGKKVRSFCTLRILSSNSLVNDETKWAESGMLTQNWEMSVRQTF